MSLRDLKDKVCIVGVGDTPQGAFPDKTGDDLAAEAFSNALADCGLKREEIDALFVQTSWGGQGDYRNVGLTLGVQPKVGGAASRQHATGCYLIQQAALLLNAGMANYAAVVYGTNQRSNRNLFAAAPSELHAAYGIFNPSWEWVFYYRRYMYLYGTDESLLGQIAVHQRKYARMNPKAVQRRPLTMEDYLSSRYVQWPLHMYDYAYITDGGHCFILTTAERAKDLKKPPIYIMGMGTNEVLPSLELYDVHLRRSIHEPSGKMAMEMGGVSHKDIDALYVMESYTPGVIAGLENYGFCREGEALSWIANGRIDIGGELPVNINGGETSETYMVGWQNTCDAVRQLRNEAQERSRQIPNAEVIMCTYMATYFEHAGCLILRR